jgi:hypothetical protein
MIQNSAYSAKVATGFAIRIRAVIDGRDEPMPTGVFMRKWARRDMRG